MEFERCNGGYPGGVHSYTEGGTEIRCPICDGTGVTATRRQLFARVTELEAELDALRVPSLQFQALRTANETRQREWDPENKITLEYRGNELAGEMGEACNVVKKIARERLGLRGSRATKQQLAEELADVAICVDLIAMAESIDLGESVIAKFNATSEKLGLATRIKTAPEPRVGLMHSLMKDGFDPEKIMDRFGLNEREKEILRQRTASLDLWATMQPCICGPGDVPCRKDCKVCQSGRCPR